MILKKKFYLENVITKKKYILKYHENKELEYNKKYSIMKYYKYIKF